MTEVADLLLYPGFTVTGTLTSSLSGRPVQGASLRMVNVFFETKAAKAAISDSEGSFTLRAINPPAAMIRQAKNRQITLPITIHRIGYEQGAGNIEIPLPVDLSRLGLSKDYVIEPKNANTSGTTTTAP